MTRRRISSRLRSDRGDAVIWGILIIAVSLMLIGLVLDGGNAMAAKIRTWDIAQEAARAGANQLDLTALREHGQIRLDPIAAQAAAAQHLSAAAVTGTVSATTTDVTVTVTRSEPTLLLQAIGVKTIPVTATAHATPVTGP
jgi:Flp pilus assembly protein TadG